MISNLLSQEDNNKLTQWIDAKDKPLFIVGYDGCGKTYWALQLLLKYHVIQITSDFIKYSKDINAYLQSNLLKKDIFMMISKENQYKALLVDDIQLFSQHDKSTLNKIHKFTQTLNYKQIPVVFVCNETTDKCIKSMKLQACVIKIKFNLNHYKNILQKNHISIDKLKTTKNLNTLLSSEKFESVKNDISSNLEDTLLDIINNDQPVNEIIRKASNEYSILSLNLVENIPHCLQKIKRDMLYSTYKAICIDDYIEYKYLQCNLDMDTRVFFSIVLPLHYVRIEKPTISTIKYNTYISRSMIQIHNQGIIKDKSGIYLSILKTIYEYISSIKGTNTLPMIRDKIKKHSLDRKTLEKQIKVFNYYYNKTVTKKQVVNILKQLTF